MNSSRGICAGIALLMALGFQARISAAQPKRAIHALENTVTQWAKVSGRSLVADRALHRAASVLLREYTDDIPAATAIAAARRLGWSDGNLALLQMAYTPNHDPHKLLEAELGKSLTKSPHNRFGLAVHTSNNRSRLLVMLSQRVVQLGPLRDHVKRRALYRVSGTVLRQYRGIVKKLWFVVGMGDRVRQYPVKLSRGEFAQTLTMPGKSMIVDVQLMSDLGQGPKIAAQWPVRIGNAKPIAASMATSGATDDNPTSGLAALILKARSARKLSTLSYSNALAAEALEHAKDMLAHGFFAHVSPSRGDLASRLDKSSFPYTRALENLAVGPNAHTIFQQWMGSPSHRANLLDAKVEQFGLGVMENPKRPGEYHAVLILARSTPTASRAALR